MINLYPTPDEAFVLQDLLLVILVSLVFYNHLIEQFYILICYVHVLFHLKYEY